MLRSLNRAADAERGELSTSSKNCSSFSLGVIVRVLRIDWLLLLRSDLSFRLNVLTIESRRVRSCNERRDGKAAESSRPAFASSGNVSKVGRSVLPALGI